MRKKRLFGLIAMLTVFALILLSQALAIGEPASLDELGSSSADAAQDDSLYKQKPNAADAFSSDLPESFMIGDYGGVASASAILELQNSPGGEGESILEYTLVLCPDNSSFEVKPLWKITPIQSNGSVIGLVGNDPENGNFMWLTEYSGFFPSLLPSEALEVLSSHGYGVQGDDAKLVYFDYESYWMFDVSMGGNVTGAFVSFSDRKIKLAADMVSRLLQLQADDSCIAYGGLPSVEETSEPVAYASSYPSTYDWMVGKVPYFMQGGTQWCAVFSMKQVFWWYGRTDISEFDIANYYGISTSEGLYIGDMKDAFIHWLGNDDPDKLDYSWGSSDIETEKSWIYYDSPSICNIHAPGSGGDEDAINHFVTLVGWDDSLGGGSWAVHDTAPWIRDPSGNGYDVWVSYTTFDTYWKAYYYKWWDFGWHYARRGSFSVIPGDGKYPDPSVGIAGLQDITETETLTLTVWLKNTGSDRAGLGFSGSITCTGVFVRFDGAEIVSADLLGFQSCAAYDEQGNEIPLVGAKIIELYTDMFVYHGPPAQASGSVTIRPTKAGKLWVYYRGWIMDEDDMAREDWITINDDRPGLLNTTLAEYRILRDPYDFQNDRDNFLDYPTYESTYWVIDDDTTGPSFSNPTTYYEETTKIFRLLIDVDDASGISTVKFRIKLAYTPWSPWIQYTGSGTYAIPIPHPPWWKIITTFYYDIPYDTWKPFSGSILYWQAYAEDNDNDLVDDTASTYSEIYTVYLPIIPSYGVDVSIDPSTNVVTPGASTSYTLNIHNTGNVQDTYSLKLTGLNPAWYAFSTTSVTVGAGQTAQVTLTISPPYASMILKDYLFVVTATSQGDPSVSDSVSASATVDFTPTLPATPTGGLAIAVQPKTIYMSAGTKIVVNILVINNQNFDDAIWINLTNSGIPTQYQANLAWFNWTNVKVFIPAGSNINIPLEINVPPETPIGMYIFRAVATSTANPAITAKDAGIIKPPQ